MQSLDIVVFGRATALRVEEIVKPNTPFPELKPESTEYCLNRLDQFRWQEGSMKTADARLEMQRVMQVRAIATLKLLRRNCTPRTPRSLRPRCHQVSTWNRTPLMPRYFSSERFVRCHTFWTHEL